jgi:hypothetical protein
MQRLPRGHCVRSRATRREISRLNLSVFFFKREILWREAAGKDVRPGSSCRTGFRSSELSRLAPFVDGEPELTEILPQLGSR